MVYARVFCFTCQAKFDIYPDQMFTVSDDPRFHLANCPHCGSAIPQKAFGKLHDVTLQAEEIEKDLRSAADTDGATLFSVDWVNYHPRTGRKPKAV